MRSTRVRATALVMLSASVFLGCAKVEAPTILDARAKPPVIYAVNYPLTWMAERIGGDAADVRFAAPPDVDPAYWQPDRDTVAALQQADGILLNGADYAKWVKTSTLPEKALVNTSAAFSDQYLTVADATMHSHGPEGMHAHEGTDFNTWLDPVLAAKQAEAVCEALCTWVPEQAEIFRDRLSRVKNDLAELDEALQAYASLIGSAPLIASHPVYGYLAKRYRWNLVSLHWEPGEMPSAEEWKAFEKRLQTHPATTMIWEDTPDARIAMRLDALGIRIAVFAPCGNRPEEGDYLSVMQENVKQLRRVLGDV